MTARPRREAARRGGQLVAEAAVEADLDPPEHERASRCEHHDHRRGEARDEPDPQRGPARERPHASAAVLADAVPDAAQRLDARAAERLVDLVAQPGDVHVDDVAAQVGLAVPDLVEDLLPGDDATRALREQVQYVELACRQLDRRASPSYLPALRVDAQVAELEDRQGHRLPPAMQ